MKKFFLLSFILLIATALSTPAFAQKKCKKKKKDKSEAIAATVFTSNNDTISYIIGADIAKSFVRNSIDLNTELVFKGFKDAQSKADTIFTDEQIGKIMAAWQEEMKAKKQSQTEIVVSENKKIGEAFLAENKTKEGVVELPSGLQYKVIKPGEGESPDDNDMVSVHYTGTLVDGTKFDSSRDRGEPIEFPVNGVIAGWTEGLKLMKPGAIFMLYIPAELAYGDKKTGPIPEGSTLIFEVEMLEFEKK